MVYQTNFIVNFYSINDTNNTNITYHYEDEEYEDSGIEEDGDMYDDEDDSEFFEERYMLTQKLTL